MDSVARFQAYAADFEKAVENDDWSVVAPHFTEDAVYETFAPAPMGGKVEGRDALMAHFRNSLDGWDRRFDTRELQLLEGPALRDGAVWMRWRVTYRHPDVPDVAIDGEERAWFRGDRIRRLEDRMDEESVRSSLELFARYQADLKPA
jgi:ketosteroid isomerase-like protein